MAAHAGGFGSDFDGFLDQMHKQNLKNQSKEVSTRDESKGLGGTRRASNLTGDLVRSIGTVTTLYENFERAAQTYGTHECWGRRTSSGYTWLTFKESHQFVQHFGRGLMELMHETWAPPADDGGEKKSPLRTVGIYGRNCVEWVVAENACNAHSLVSVAIYDTFGADAVQYILNHAEISVVIGEAACLRKLAPALAACPRVNTLIQFSEAADDDSFAASLGEKGIKWHLFKSVTEAGSAIAEDKFPPSPPKPQDLAILMYTSGTTGMPKGVMITHQNLISAAAGVMATLPKMDTKDVFISYLPLAHIFERCAQVVMNAYGCAIGFYGGDARTLTEDISVLRPTVMAGVPRVYDRMQMGIRAKVNAKGRVSQKIFNSALGSSKKHQAKGKVGSSGILGGIAFKRVKQTLGGRLRCAISGGAPISPETHAFVQACFGCPVLQGYGLTETCAASTIVIWGDPDFGHVGAPLACLEIRLVDVPEMNYSSSNTPPTGEVCMRGPCVSQGYFKEPEKTAEAWDEDGWFHSGDIGRWNPNGSLSIIDRKKNIFKLSQGEYIAAENIELVLKTSPFVSQIFIYGDSFKNCLLALVAPNPPRVADWAKAQKIAVPDLVAFCSDTSNAVLAEAILADLVAVGRAARLQSFELPRAVIVIPELTVEEDLLTPTMKLKRPNIKNRYQAIIDSTYAKFDEQ